MVLVLDMGVISLIILLVRLIWAVKEEDKEEQEKEKAWKEDFVSSQECGGGVLNTEQQNERPEAFQEAFQKGKDDEGD